MISIKQMFNFTDNGYRELKKGVFAVTLTNLSLMIPVAVSVQLFIQIFNYYNGGSEPWKNLWILAAIGVIGFLLIFIAGKNDYRKTYVNSYKEASDTRIRIAQIIKNLPMNVFYSKSLTELTSNMMGDCAVIEHTLSHALPPLFANIISCFIISVVFAFFSWKMALAVFITLPASILIIVLSRKAQNKMSRKKVNAKLNAAEQTQQYIEGIKLIKSYNLNGESFSKLKNALDKMRRVSIQMEVGAGVLLSGAQFVLKSGIAITVCAGVMLLANNQVSLIPFIISLMLCVRLYGPIITLLTLLPEVFHLQVCNENVKKLSEIPIYSGNDDIVPENFNVNFENVCFGYNDREIIHNLNFNIKQNTVTALVGPSGSGKSTVARLLSRFWEVNNGNIQIGGIDIKQISPDHLMDYITVVFQDVILFNDTILNNIKIGNPEATEEQINHAIKAARCDEFIDKLKDGCNTVLGENGNTLSGGQRQRISIARAILKNAPIVILDEATSSLDPENEILIQQAITELTRNKTVLVIAHKLRTIEKADQILVLENGRIKESGNHESLMNSGTLYSKLFKIQNSNNSWNV